jgi:hypothetical protein
MSWLAYFIPRFEPPNTATRSLRTRSSSQHCEDLTGHLATRTIPREYICTSARTVSPSPMPSPSSCHARYRTIAFLLLAVFANLYGPIPPASRLRNAWGQGSWNNPAALVSSHAESWINHSLQDRTNALWDQDGCSTINLTHQLA